MIKKVWKMHPPSKTPKCHLNGQNRHFVKSEPPGPALFEFQGVPRDPVLRPKSDPPFLNGKKWSHFVHFVILWIYHFTILWHFWYLINCEFVVFTQYAPFVIRPYYALHRVEYELLLPFSPLITIFNSLSLWFVFVF